MNRLQKSFLATQRKKIIPFNPQRMNYGFSSVDGGDLSRASAFIVGNNLVISNLPSDSSLVAILLRIPQINELVVSNPDITDDDLRNRNLIVDSVQAAPPGLTSVAFSLSSGEEYFIYLLSNEYNDGYLTDESTLILATSTSADRRRFTGSDAVITIDDVQLVRTNTKDVWYDYTGTYDSENRIWEDPRPLFAINEGNGGSYTYLTYQRTFLEQLVSDFAKAFDFDGPEGRELLRSELRSRTSRNAFGASQVTIDNFQLNQALRTLHAMTYTTLTFEKWNDSPLLVGSPPATDLLNTLAKTGNIYKTSVYDLIGRFPSERSAVDPIPEYNFANAPEQHAAGVAVIIQYVVDAYEGVNPNRSFAEVFSRNSTVTSPIGNQYDDLARAVRDAITLRNRESTAPVLFEEGTNLLQTLTILAAPGTPDAGRAILLEVSRRLDKYENALTVQAPAYAQLFIDPFVRSTEPAASRFLSRIVNFTENAFINGFEYIDQQLTDTDVRIAELGEFNFIPLPGSEGGDLQLAHDATLQNIRWLRGLIESYGNDLWTQSTNFSSYIIRKIDELTKNTLDLTARANTLVAFTDTRVQNNDIEVLWKEYDADSWQPLPGGVTDQGNGIKTVDVSQISRIGNYLVLIRPRSLNARITSITDGQYLVSPDLENYQSPNYFFGWNIEFTSPVTGNLSGFEQRMIVGSRWTIGQQQLLISPNVFGVDDIPVSVNARLWANTFVPIMIDIEVTEHSLETLSYAQYGQREFNRSNGVLTLYDYQGNVYKQWTIGERSLASEGGEIIEFRDPIE